MVKKFIDCPWCGQATRPEPLHGHYICTSCRRPLADCCDGELEEDYREQGEDA
tara:strand:+ start:248 stop:406 length:159 start_codon:yes stop_codon:yes gene_type:complete